MKKHHDYMKCCAFGGCRTPKGERSEVDTSVVVELGSMEESVT